MNRRVEEIKARLAEIEKEKHALLTELDSLSAAGLTAPALLGVPACLEPPGTLEGRVALFLKLFRCREDIFPKFWENSRIEGDVVAIVALAE
jgi:hypothetical protein